MEICEPDGSANLIRRPPSPDSRRRDRELVCRAPGGLAGLLGECSLIKLRLFAAWSSARSAGVPREQRKTSLLPCWWPCCVFCRSAMSPLLLLLLLLPVHLPPHRHP